MLRGLFAGYVQKAGGAWTGDVFIFDLIELSEKKLASQVHLRRVKAGEMQANFLDGKFQFPVAEGKISQPEDTDDLGVARPEKQIDPEIEKGAEDHPTDQSSSGPLGRACQNQLFQRLRQVRSFRITGFWTMTV